MTICAIFVVANSVPIEVILFLDSQLEQILQISFFQANKAKRVLENLAFKASSLGNKQKIERISGLTVEFTCSDWMRMGSHQVLVVSSRIDF